MDSPKRDFNKEAAGWDENPVRVKLAGDIFKALCTKISWRADMRVMDFGCGTGLLARQIAPRVALVTGVDSSPGMLDVFRGKALAQGLENTEGVLLDPDGGASLPEGYDAIVSGMTLHHVDRVAPLLSQFYRSLRPGGYLGIADLDSEDGAFHEDATGVFHQGFERSDLCQMFSDAGFESVRADTAAEVNKPNQQGVVQCFTVFLVVGCRR